MVEGPALAQVRSELVATELRLAEQELITSRGDVTEVDGDLEVATMDWHRERQDAETTLHAYRDRARELRTRIRRMESAGASLTTTEAALFEWCQEAGTSRFKQISELVRQPPPDLGAETD